MKVPPIDSEPTLPHDWAALNGIWSFGDKSATFEKPEEGAGYGLAVSNLRLSGGVITTDVELTFKGAAGRIVFGFDPVTGGYFSAGVGGAAGGPAYLLDQFVQGRGWLHLASLGSSENVQPGRNYSVQVNVLGQFITMHVDDVQVLATELPTPLLGNQVGVIAWSHGSVTFSNTYVLPVRPQAFVVMKFGAPYDDLYADVIVLTCRELGFEAYRADNVYGPGIIIQDIISGLVQASVVIAEITPVNANVFYELGYAHALGKPTILLAERGVQLPFDVSGYRCIFYDNTIGGKAVVEENLRRHLTNIRSFA
jgi:hypothetical protein